MSTADSPGVRKPLALLALIFSGAVQALISPPLNWWFIHPLALVPGLFVLQRLRGGHAFFGGLLMGISANLAIFYWIVHTVQTFSNIPTPGAIALLLLFSTAFGAYLAVFALLAPRVRSAAGAYWPLALAALFVGCEFLNPQLFPYYQGVAWYQLPRVFLITAVTGVPGVTFQVVLCNLLVVWLVEVRLRELRWSLPRGWCVSAMCSAAFLCLSLAVSHVRLGKIADAEQVAEVINIGLIQTNDAVPDRREMGPESIAEAHVELSREALVAKPDTDVFIFPEGALRYPPNWEPNISVMQFVADTGKEVWTGATNFKRGQDGHREVYNAAWRMAGNGHVDEPYAKNILLPFGEFMPMAETFPVLKKIQGVGNFTPGDGLTTFTGVKDTRFCFLICYEAIRHEYVRQAISDGVDLLVNITYDAWFGDTSCLTQHLMLSVIQSAEYGVPLVRAATTGISAVSDARGMIVEQTQPFTRTALVVPVKKVSVPTLYGKFGDWFAWSCVAVSAALVLLSVFRRKYAAPAAQ